MIFRSNDVAIQEWLTAEGSTSSVNLVQFSELFANVNKNLGNMASCFVSFLGGHNDRY
jgi:hypothetical protein